MSVFDVTGLSSSPPGSVVPEPLDMKVHHFDARGYFCKEVDVNRPSLNSVLCVFADAQLAQRLLNSCTSHIAGVPAQIESCDDLADPCKVRVTWENAWIHAQDFLDWFQAVTGMAETPVATYALAKMMPRPGTSNHMAVASPAASSSNERSRSRMRKLMHLYPGNCPRTVTEDDTEHLILLNSVDDGANVVEWFWVDNKALENATSLRDCLNSEHLTWRALLQITYAPLPANTLRPLIYVATPP